MMFAEVRLLAGVRSLMDSQGAALDEALATAGLLGIGQGYPGTDARWCESCSDVAYQLSG